MAEVRVLRAHSLPAHAVPVYGVHAGARSRWYRHATVCFPRAVRAPFALRMRALSYSLWSVELGLRGGAWRCKAFSFRGQVVLVADSMWKESGRLLELSAAERAKFSPAKN